MDSKFAPHLIVFESLAFLVHLEIFVKLPSAFAPPFPAFIFLLHVSYMHTN